MPIPKKQSSETQQDYIGRCMHEISGEYPQEQAIAICINSYEQGSLSKSTADRVTLKINGLNIANSIRNNDKGITE
jgi:hypothetical protein